MVAALGAVALIGALAWRVHAQKAALQRPSGGSATVEGIEVEVSTKIAGRIREVTVQSGDRVRRSQVIARLDCMDQEANLRAAQAQLQVALSQVGVAEAQSVDARNNAAVAASRTASARAEGLSVEAANEQAAREADRTFRLRNEGAVAAVEWEKTDTQRRQTEAQHKAALAALQTTMLSARSAESAAAAAKTKVDAAKAAVDTAKAELARAEIHVSECTLLAPRDAIVTDRLLEPGAVVGQGTRVVQTIDLSTAKLVFFLPNAELGRAGIGARAEVRVDAYPGRVFQGRVQRIASEAEFTPRNVQTREDRDRLVYAVEVHVDNPDTALRAGMPADIVLPESVP
ncbi:HlyD family efflux transporter periplasmic adaptor subunit [Pendulispora albinea]|uniref:HlyD family efflux transporter periplasmic adaptor subunit n=2 Tax=Pendulispora albinea TaxID=2741071 RepID=A0ABZ2MCW2_9BACT